MTANTTAEREALVASLRTSAEIIVEALANELTNTLCGRARRADAEALVAFLDAADVPLRALRAAVGAARDRAREILTMEAKD